MQRSACVTGWGQFLPNAPVDNAQIEEILGRIESQPSSVKRRVLASNGIETRHFAIDPLTKSVTHTNAQLTAAAILDLCRRFDF